jgi:uncharacterized membrane protein YeaQ/YmgE (transglycosylase-associated protein family)
MATVAKRLPFLFMETMYSILSFLLVGFLAGWLAGKIVKGSGFGLAKNIILGIVGSFVGGFLFWLLGFSSSGFLASVVVSTVGALLTIYLANKFKI